MSSWCIGMSFLSTWHNQANVYTRCRADMSKHTTCFAGQTAVRYERWEKLYVLLLYKKIRLQKAPQHKGMSFGTWAARSLPWNTHYVSRRYSTPKIFYDLIALILWFSKQSAREDGFSSIYVLGWWWGREVRCFQLPFMPCHSSILPLAIRSWD